MDHSDDIDMANGPITKKIHELNYLTDPLFTTLAVEASQNTNTMGMMYGRRDVKTDLDQFYGTVLCTIDLSPSDCTECLKYIAK